MDPMEIHGQEKLKDLEFADDFALVSSRFSLSGPGLKTAKCEKVDSLHVPAIRLLGRISWSINFQLYF